MRRGPSFPAFLFGVFIGAMGVAIPVQAEFGWTDSGKLERIAVACETILAEIRSLRYEQMQRARAAAASPSPAASARPK